MLNSRRNDFSRTYKLHIFTLGQFKIIMENGEVCNISARSGKLWNLFKFLLINKDRGVPQDVILECLYPDEEYENPQNTIQNMIYRLRKLLISEQIFNSEQSGISFSNGCYRLNISEEVYTDFDTFEKYINQANNLKNNDPDRAVELYCRAFEIYKGEFLPELVFEDWVIPQRAYYSKLYITCLFNLSEIYKQKNEYDMIVQVCHKALVNQPYEEEIYILLIENLVKIGKIREANRQYKDMVNIFEKQFGISPTVPMQQVEKLLKADYFNVKNESVKVASSKEQQAEGAFYCGYREFYAIYILEKRRGERSGEPICPVSIKLDNGKNVFESEKQLTLAVKNFKKILSSSLRRGDTFTLINKSEFLVMLPNMEFRQVCFVIDRIINKFKSEEANKNIYLNAQVFLPTE